MRYHIAVLIVASLFMAACASTEEQVQTAAPPVVKEKETKPIEPEREFTFTERYFVKNAVIGDPKDVSDPLQAIRVIQLQPGDKQVLVISSFDKLGEKTLETWMGIEMPEFKPGTHYDLATAKISFYRFYLGDDRKRIDASSCTGKMKIESNDDGALIGSIDASLNGKMRAFDAKDSEVQVRFSGSFRIKETELENTIMKSR